MAEDDHYKSAGDNKGQPCQNPTENAFLKITHVNSKLQRFGSREHMGETHDLDKAIFRQPMTALDHLVIHHRNLGNRSTNVDETQKEKIQKYLPRGRHLFI